MKLLIFDIDGVLVDVSQSYNVAIKKTVEFFIGKKIEMSVVLEFKERPGMNNDWDCTEAILKHYNHDIRKKVIIKKFQEYYLQKDFKGLINEEKLLIKQVTLKSLAKKHVLAIFTGRPKDEASFILEKFNLTQYFKVIVTMADVEKQKPDPEGIKKIMAQLKMNDAVYIGDSLDDAEAASNANVDFIGVIPYYKDKEYLTSIFMDNDVKTIIEDINNISV